MLAKARPQSTNPPSTGHGGLPTAQVNRDSTHSCTHIAKPTPTARPESQSCHGELYTKLGQDLPHLLGNIVCGNQLLYSSSFREMMRLTSVTSQCLGPYSLRRLETQRGTRALGGLCSGGRRAFLHSGEEVLHRPLNATARSFLMKAMETNLL